MARFADRIACWHDTLRRVEHLPAPPPSVKVSHTPVSVEVHDADSIDCGLRLQREGFHPVVLNLADDCFPGGCVATGSGAQEESLFRRTDYCRTLSLSLYPIRDEEAVYSPGVTVLKTSEAAGWAPLPEPLPKLCFIACPALRHPTLVDGRLSAADVARLTRKLHVILAVALRHGHDAVVLGAMGCGAWRNPASHVAEVFAGVLPTYRWLFKRLVIAVLRGSDDMHAVRQRAGTAGADNLDVFRRRFADPPGRDGPASDLV